MAAEPDALDLIPQLARAPAAGILHRDALARAPGRALPRPYSQVQILKRAAGLLSPRRTALRHFPETAARAPCISNGNINRPAACPLRGPWNSGIRKLPRPARACLASLALRRNRREAVPRDDPHGRTAPLPSPRRRGVEEWQGMGRGRSARRSLHARMPGLGEVAVKPNG